MCDNEEWRPIEGYPAYEVSSLARVRRVETGRILQPKLNGPYLAVNLYKDGRAKTRKIHRLFAEAFIPNPENKSDVDHVNRIKTDNRLENLRWSTHCENTRNKPRQCNNSSGFIGVHYHSQARKFHARIKINRKIISLGLYITAEEAGLVASAARRKAFGEFYNANT